MRALTEYLNSDSIFSSGYGNISHKEWMELEVKRITADGSRQACIKSDLNGNIQLMVNPIEKIKGDCSSWKSAGRLTTNRSAYAV